MENVTGELEDVDEFLEKLEMKYSPKRKERNMKCSSRNLLMVLSEEFESLGLSGLDCNQTVTNILEQVANIAHVLVQVHRKSLIQMKDVNIDSVSKEHRNHGLEKTLADFTAVNSNLTQKVATLNNRLLKLTCDNNDLKKVISRHSDETEKIKRYFRSKHNESVHQINSLQEENQRLKVICGKEFGNYLSNDDKFLKTLRKNRRSEEISRSTIHKLQENNTDLMTEVINLKEELATTYLTNSTRN